MARQLYIDLERIVEGTILAAQVIRKSGTTDEYFLHCMIEADGDKPDFKSKGPHYYEKFKDLPASMKRPDGKPAHEFWGHPADPPAAVDLPIE